MKVDIEALRLASVVIGYYIPNRAPEFIGSGFFVGEGQSVITCAHVVTFQRNGDIYRIPLSKDIDSINAELCCWAFYEVDDRHVIIKLPIKEVATYTDPYLSDYFINSSPDVAWLKLDMTHWNDKIGDKSPTVLKVSESVVKEIGREVAIIGYPSPAELLVSDSSGKPKCMEAIVQFARLAGVLPFKKNQLTNLLAFDCLIAKGSSGSPIIDLQSGNVVAMAAQLHPFYLPSFVIKGRDPSMDFERLTLVPSGIGFGVPSNIFYELSISEDGIGKFDFNKYI